jgi:hypothetical protein
MFEEMGFVSTFVHAVYCGNDFYAQVSLSEDKFRHRVRKR